MAAQHRRPACQAVKLAHLAERNRVLHQRLHRHRLQATHRANHSCVGSSRLSRCLRSRDTQLGEASTNNGGLASMSTVCNLRTREHDDDAAAMHVAVIAACLQRLSLRQRLAHHPRQHQLRTQTSGCLRLALGHWCCLRPRLLQCLQPALWRLQLQAAVNKS